MGEEYPNETRTLIERSKLFETWRDYGATGYAKRFAADAIAEIERLARENAALTDKLANAVEGLRNIRNAALPDPYDERDISLEWLRKIINKNGVEMADNEGVE